MKLFLALLLLTLSLTARTQTVTRKVVFQQGRQYEKIATNRSEMSFSAMGQNRTMLNEITITMLITIDQVMDTAYLVNSTVTRKQFNISGMGQDIEFDSDSAEDREDQMGKVLLDGIGKKLRVMVDKNGNIISSEDTVSLTEDVTAAAGSLANLVNAARRPGQNFELVAPLPQKPMKVGDQWSDTVNIDSTQGIVNYRVRAINNEVATVGHTGNVRNVVELNNNGVKTVIRSAGTVTGNFTFDPRTGILKTSTNTTIADCIMEVVGQSIPLSLKTVNTTTIKPK